MNSDPIVLFSTYTKVSDGRIRCKLRCETISIMKRYLTIKGKIYNPAALSFAGYMAGYHKIKDYAASDAIRDALTEIGIVVMQDGDRSRIAYYQSDACGYYKNREADLRAEGMIVNEENVKEIAKNGN